MSNPITISPNDRIVFYDGVCGLCNRFVDWCLSQDKAHTIKFAPLQGETAKALLPDNLTSSLKTVVFFDQGQILTHSSAVIRIAQALGYSPLLTVPMRLIPRPLRDVGYNSVSALRYFLFGKKETCRMPKPQERALFLP
ncbi:thiol-disulfide oxidoreductase DCC family protein [Lacunimicrobium album]